MLEGLKQRLQTDGKLIIDVKVIPRATQTEIMGVMNNGALKVKVAAVPDQGKANVELREFLAQQFGVGKGMVTIIAGETSQRKIIRISHS
jgi:uncharacterized protein (TIGR00251 family)